jgi:predicted nucleic acid-binding protein
MKRIVLDASALMTFFENRPGAAKVEALLQQAVADKLHLLMSVVNWGEVYYSTWRAHGPGVARKIIEDIAQLPIELVEANLDLTRTAAEFRADHKLPYTDCFAASLAAHRKAALATSDQDFAPVEKKIDILWTSA